MCLTVTSRTSGMLASSMLGNVLFAELFLAVHEERIIVRTMVIPKTLNFFRLIIFFVIIPHYFLKWELI